MKKMVWIAALLLSSAGWAEAQSGGGGVGNGRSTSVSATGTAKPLHTAKRRVTVRDKKGHKHTVTRTVPLKEEKEYKWKDGQAATPTGHEATGVNGNAVVAPPKRDSLNRKPRR